MMVRLSLDDPLDVGDDVYLELPPARTFVFAADAPAARGPGLTFGRRAAQ